MLAVAGVVTLWGRLNADDRFYAIVVAVAGAFALGFASTFHAFCTTLAIFGWMTIGFALFTLATGYSIGWRSVRVVESASGIIPFILGLFLVVIAYSAKRLVRRTECMPRESYHLAVERIPKAFASSCLPLWIR